MTNRNVQCVGLSRQRIIIPPHAGARNKDVPVQRGLQHLEIVNFSQGQIEAFCISVDRVQRQPGEQQDEKRNGRNGRCDSHGDAATTGAP